MRAQEKLDYLSITDLTTGKSKPVVTFTNLKLINLWWKSDDLILLLVENDVGYRDFRSFNLKTQKTSFLYGFNKKASTIINPLLDDPDNVLVATYSDDGTTLRRLNVRTGKAKEQQGNPGRVWFWLTNRQGAAVAGLGHLDKKWFMLFPGQNGKPWRRVELGERNPPDFYPLTVAPDQAKILGLDYTAGNTTAVSAWNPVDDSRDTIWRSDEVDAESGYAWGDDHTHTRAILYQKEHPEYYYLTQEDAALAKSIDQALPGTANLVVSTSADESRLIIKSDSPTQPERFFLLDRKTGRIAGLGSPYPQLDPARMSPARYFTTTSADGLVIHGRLHLPQNPPNLPPAVLLADADDSRAVYAYQPILQYFANRGYAMIEVDQRGTHGYGEKFAVAGDMQLATGVPDDYAAAVRWAIKEGLVDGGRIAIMGQGKAGLASLHTLARHPELFRAWINLAIPMEAKALESGDVLFGRYSEAEVKALIGDSFVSEKYLRSVDGFPLLDAVHVPSFHFYQRSTYDNTILHDGARVEKFFAKTKLPYLFVKGTPTFSLVDLLTTWDETPRAESKRIFEQLIAFLDQYLADGK